MHANTTDWSHSRKCASERKTVSATTTTLTTLTNLQGRSGIEWELDPDMQRTGRWRRRQFYSFPKDRRLPSERKPADWRDGVPR
jgi:hypothetical protein